MKYGLTLEGGGARGAYHIGAVKALVENGYDFDAVVGTSIGAINAAFIAQGDLEEIYNMWHTMSYGDLFDIDGDQMQKAFDIKIDKDVVKYFSKKLGQAIKEKGIDTIKMREMLKGKINEEKLRKSKVKFGLVTYCLSDRTGEEVFIDDINKGQVIDYLMASSNLPVFKRVSFNDKKYLDGGVYDNCPVNMLERAGYKEIIAIRTYKRIRIRDYRGILKRDNVVLHMIQPVDMLPGILNFHTDALNEMLKMGYYDALKTIKNLDGIRFYILPEDTNSMRKRINSLKIKDIEKIASLAKVGLDVGYTIYEMFEHKVIPFLASRTKNKNVNNLKDDIYAIVEHVAMIIGVQRYQVYSFDELLKATKKELKTEDKAEVGEAFYKLIRCL